MAQLPIVPPKPTPTVFVKEMVDLGHDIQVTIDGNSKITAENGHMNAPKPNAFSLPHISTCPGSTEVCRSSCYVNGLALHSQPTYQAYVQNERMMHRILMLHPSGFTATSRNMAEYIKQNVTSFRWHVSGDLFSVQHAIWVNNVSLAAPDVTFWIYTRSFELVPYLDAPNLVVNLSADASNIGRALAVQEAHGLRICYMTNDGNIPKLPRDSVVFPDYALRGRDLEEPTSAPWWQSLPQSSKKQVCPADFFGQTENTRCGPCRKCMVQFKEGSTTRSFAFQTETEVVIHE